MKLRDFWVSDFWLVNPPEVRGTLLSTGVNPLNSPPFSRTYVTPTMMFCPLSCVSPAGLKDIADRGARSPRNVFHPLIRPLLALEPPPQVILFARNSVFVGF